MYLQQNSCLSDLLKLNRSSPRHTSLFVLTQLFPIFTSSVSFTNGYPPLKVGFIIKQLCFSWLALSKNKVALNFKRVFFKLTFQICFQCYIQQSIRLHPITLFKSNNPIYLFKFQTTLLCIEILNMLLSLFFHYQISFLGLKSSTFSSHIKLSVDSFWIIVHP